jgi:hypothetical protein
MNRCPKPKDREGPSRASRHGYSSDSADAPGASGVEVQPEIRAGNRKSRPRRDRFADFILDTDEWSG